MFKKSIINLRECLLFGHNNSSCSSVAILRVQRYNSSTTATMCICSNAYKGSDIVASIKEMKNGQIA